MFGYMIFIIWPLMRLWYFLGCRVVHVIYQVFICWRRLEKLLLNCITGCKLLLSWRSPAAWVSFFIGLLLYILFRVTLATSFIKMRRIFFTTNHCLRFCVWVWVDLVVVCKASHASFLNSFVRWHKTSWLSAERLQFIIFLLIILVRYSAKHIPRRYWLRRYTFLR